MFFYNKINIIKEISPEELKKQIIEESMKDWLSFRLWIQEKNRNLQSSVEMEEKEFLYWLEKAGEKKREEVYNKWKENCLLRLKYGK